MTLSQLVRLTQGDKAEYLKDIVAFERQAQRLLNTGGILLDAPGPAPFDVAKEHAVQNCARRSVSVRQEFNTAVRLAEEDPLSDYVFEMTRSSYLLGLVLGWGAAGRVQNGGAK